MTLKQQIVYNFIVAFIKKVGISPTYDEIMKATGIKHKSVLHQYILRLEREGKIIRNRTKTRKLALGKNVIENETLKKIQKLKEDLETLSTFLCIPDENTKEQVKIAYSMTNMILLNLEN